MISVMCSATSTSFTRRLAPRRALRVALAVTLALSAAPARAEQLALRVTETGSDAPVPCRVHLEGPDGEPVRAPGLPFWHDHFVCEGEVSLDVGAGEYRLTVERGPEYRRVRRTVSVEEDRGARVEIAIRRLANMSREGWWSGELHIHRALEQVPLHVRAEDLRIAPVLTEWNRRNLWSERPLPEKRVVDTGGGRFYDVLACEDERQGGALLYFHLERPLALGVQGPEFPSPVANLERALEQGGVWVDIEKPFWWDAPTWAATGKAHSVGLANNHMCRSTVLGNEAWGRARADRVAAVWERPSWGNGLYTQELYYRLLNCGFRLAPSAGSASGVLPNPVGYNRVYVHLDGELSWASWWEGLRAGRCFVTNGPLLTVTAKLDAADGRAVLPGATLRAAKGAAIDIDAGWVANDAVSRVELVSDGRATELERLPRADADGDERGRSRHRLVAERSGWFLVRVICDVEETFRFASTAPFWLEVDGEPARPRREDVQFFLRWVEDRMAAIRAGGKEPLEGARLDAVLAPHIEAQKRFMELLEAAG